ncbi:iron permease FTR1 [Gloeophyllum trabeum ATCC 11539]|uniref:Iron permease FTR1 n=1 Tax=Gloeophyllum trabeum (strain ATCC 11539 / FP-39264 / Madison 617) TaxID=670483 RepID=S7RLP0_GLOTA|nr:iron permease FTR1 [Gloeophyllum trabeum ATCC 11539]EPQ53599.1 iron permease FTR1 [Gloeophyllum trabeum ATCC 11539]
MARNLFSVPIFFIVWRETLEAAIIISVLLGLVEQIVKDEPGRITGGAVPELRRDDSVSEGTGSDSEVEDVQVDAKKLIKKLRMQIFIGGAIGLLVALAIGAAFIAVWFTQASNLWQKSEELWEGIFEFIASLMIFVMGVTMLKLDRAKAKWRVKLQKAFDGRRVDRQTLTGRWVLLILPLITVLREGIEAVIFVGGVSLGQPATAIPIAAIVGLICGLACGFVIYQFASRTTLRVFLVVMTNFLLLIGAGLFSKAIWAFQENAFNNLLGADVDDTGGDGPGSFDVRGNVWHLDCCNPDNNVDGQGWLIFGAIFGWTNSATVGSVLSYVFYWLAVIAVLVYMKFKEGRTRLFGRYESAAGKRRRIEREAREALPQ